MPAVPVSSDDAGRVLNGHWRGAVEASTPLSLRMTQEKGPEVIRLRALACNNLRRGIAIAQRLILHLLQPCRGLILRLEETCGEEVPLGRGGPDEPRNMH